MELAILILSAVAVVTLIVLLILVIQLRQEDRYEDILDKLSDQRRELNDAIHSSLTSYGQLMDKGQDRFARQQNDNQQSFQQAVELRMDAFERANQERLASFEKASVERLDGICTTLDKRLAALQENNSKELLEIREVVGEKLQSTLENRISKSFEMVSKQLEAVYKGLGEMQQVAAGVTDLKKVLSNVKTRGILGEIQLGAILEEILSPEQYDTNVATRPGSTERVEYAVKLPGTGETPVYLPIDAKFPGDTYAALMNAYDAGDPNAIAAAAAALTTRLKQEAKDVSGKYIAPPATTDFAIIFLPFEGLYAEAVNRGMVEELQKRYKVNLAGPSTMAALLNSLSTVAEASARLLLRAISILVASESTCCSSAANMSTKKSASAVGVLR
jgi:DNA recombination protein RmuC